MKTLFRRRHYLIHGPFQLGHLVRIALNQTAVGLAVALASAWFFLVFLEEQLVCEVNSRYLLHILLVLGGFQLMALLFSLLYTHRIAGPVYRVRKHLREAAEGRLPDHPVHLRKRDHFKELAGDLNRCMETMKGYRSALLEAASAIEALEARRRREGMSSEEVGQDLERILHTLSEKKGPDGRGA